MFFDMRQVPSNAAAASAPQPKRPRPRDIVDEMSDDSFPASDVPGWAPLRVGRPPDPVKDGSPRSTPV
jgi:hypothetical protein